MEEKEANSIAQFVDIICEMNENLVRNGANRNEVLFFRGQSDTSFELMPSLGRKRKSSCDISIFDEERNMIEMAKYKMPDIFGEDLQPIELLALLQHYGIPTRLLDITENALVALYFACCSDLDEKEKDGEVIVFKRNELDITNHPIVNAIADSYRFSRGTLCTLDLFYGAIISQPYFLEQKQVHEICFNKEEDKEWKKKGGEWVRKCCQNPLFVYAPIKSMRQQMQQSSFILFPNKITDYGDGGEYCFESQIEPIQKNHESVCACIKIPQDSKTKMLNDLKLHGISKQTLFADSVDIVCEGIKNIYNEKIYGR